MKKKSLSLSIGPPRVPHTEKLCRRSSRCHSDRCSSYWHRDCRFQEPKALPWSVLPPLFMLARTVPPFTLPNSALAFDSMTLISANASGSCIADCVVDVFVDLLAVKQIVVRLLRLPSTDTWLPASMLRSVESLPPNWLNRAPPLQACKPSIAKNHDHSTERC